MDLVRTTKEGFRKVVIKEFACPLFATPSVHTFWEGFVENIGLATLTASRTVTEPTFDRQTGGFIEIFATDLATHFKGMMCFSWIEKKGNRFSSFYGVPVICHKGIIIQIRWLEEQVPMVRLYYFSNIRLLVGLLTVSNQGGQRFWNTNKYKQYQPNIHSHILQFGRFR